MRRSGITPGRSGELWNQTSGAAPFLAVGGHGVLVVDNGALTRWSVFLFSMFLYGIELFLKVRR
jgi:hypothetical protein